MNLFISAVEDVIVAKEIRGKLTNSEPQRVKAEEILALVKDRTKGDFSTVKNIFLNMGPGSFTGIRAGMALVLGLTAGKNIPVIPFTSFDALEYDRLSADKILAVNGFSNFVYIKFIQNRKERMECIEKEKLAMLAKEKKKTVITYSLPLIEYLNGSKVKTQKVDFDLNFVLQKYKNNLLDNIAFEPVYLRLSQAELQRKGETK